MENELELESTTDATETKATEKVDTRVELTDAEKLARLEGSAKRLRRKLGLDASEIREEVKEAKIEKTKRSDEFGLTELTFLKVEGIKSDDELKLVQDELALAGYKKDRLHELIGNPYFKSKLENLRTAKANSDATAEVKGGGAGESEAKQSAEYWIKRGELPEQNAANRALRVKIANALRSQQKNSKVFYND